jgi:phosphoheptose isomerase
MEIVVTLHMYLKESAVREPAAKSWSEQLIADAISTMVSTLCAGKPLLICGSGGLRCDAYHRRTRAILVSA